MHYFFSHIGRKVVHGDSLFLLLLIRRLTIQCLAMCYG